MNKATEGLNKLFPKKGEENMKELGKFRLGERVKVKLDIKTDFPTIGYITKAVIRLGYYFYTVKFDKELFKKPIYSNVYSLSVKEDRLIKLSKEKRLKCPF